MTPFFVLFAIVYTSKALSTFDTFTVSCVVTLLVVVTSFLTIEGLLTVHTIVCVTFDISSEIKLYNIMLTLLLLLMLLLLLLSLLLLLLLILYFRSVIAYFTVRLFNMTIKATSLRE